MTHRRAPLLALVLSLALVAYPATMPIAMAGETPVPVPAPMHMAGKGAATHTHHPAHHHHALSACCAGVCGSCPVVSVAAGVSPRIRASSRVVLFQNDLPVSPQQSAARKLPYSIGPPASLA
jgi:hypothetical protein